MEKEDLLLLPAGSKRKMSNTDLSKEKGKGMWCAVLCVPHKTYQGKI